MITITKDKIYRSPFSLKRTEADSESVEEVKTSDIICLLGDEVELGDDVTFETLFNILIYSKDFFNVLFKKEMRGLLIDDFIDDYEKGITVEFNKFGFNLMLSWQTEVFEYDNEIEYMEYTSFEAFGRLHEEDEEDYPISLAYVSLCEIREKIIMLNHTFELHSDESYANDIGAIFKANHRSFTLYNIFSSILSEITFYGKPEQRDSMREELERRAKSFYDEGFDEDMKNWDEISDEIDDMMSQDYEDKLTNSFWDQLYPKKAPKKEIASEMQGKLFIMSDISDKPLEEQLQEAHDSEDYETAAKIKKLLDRRNSQK